MMEGGGVVVVAVGRGTAALVLTITSIFEIKKEIQTRLVRFG